MSSNTGSAEPNLRTEPNQAPGAGEGQLPARPLTQKERLEQLEGQYKQLNSDLQEIGTSLKAWMQKMEAASTAQPAPGSATAAAQTGQGQQGGGDVLSFFMDLLRASGMGLSGGSSQTDELTKQLVNELQRGYVLWLRQGVRSMSRSFGQPEHMIPG